MTLAGLSRIVQLLASPVHRYVLWMRLAAVQHVGIDLHRRRSVIVRMTCAAKG